MNEPKNQVKYQISRHVSEYKHRDQFAGSQILGVKLDWPVNRGKSKIYSRDAIIAECRVWKREGKTVVFTNGCFDILHPGHVRLLEQARSNGDLLVVALNSDASISRLKGPGRPFFDQAARAELLAHVEAVDAVTLFDEDTPRDLIAALLPDVLAKGADWTHYVAGREEVEEAGGRVVVLPLEPGYSTTCIADRVTRRFSRNP